MKKILSFMFVFAAAFLMGSCNKDTFVADVAEDGILPSSDNVTVNIEVAGLNGPSTKAIKQDWAPGDLVKIWFNYTTASQLPQLILTRNDANDGWDASELSSETVSGLKQSGGKFCVLYEASNSLFGTNINPSEFKIVKMTDQNSAKMAQVWLYHTPMVCIANDVEYSYNGETLSAVIDGWEFATQLQVVVTGIDKADAEDYAMAIFGDSGSKEGCVIGAMAHTSENKLITSSSSCSWVGGVPNADGAAFSFANLSTGQYGTPEKISLYNTKTGEEKVLSIGNADLTTTGTRCKGIKVSIDKFSVPGALPGVFSVSAAKQVRFSQGNLIATINASGTPTAWKFATNQYDCLGKGGANKTIGSAAGDVDLFGWSTAATAYGISVSEEYSDYHGDFQEWGIAIDDKGTWRTLSKDEWVYLFETRTVNGGTGAGKSYSLNITYGGRMGLVLYPDNYTESVLSGTVENLPEGLVFLPAAGDRLGSSVNGAGVHSFYWSSSDSEGSFAHDVLFTSGYFNPGTRDYRYRGCSVRLVTDVE